MEDLPLVIRSSTAEFPTTIRSLPVEILCEVLKDLDLASLSYFMRSGRLGKEAVETCVTSLREPRKEIPGSFVLSLPNLTRVEGIITVSSVILERISSRIRGPLVVRGPNLGEGSLRMVLTRGFLYPTSRITVDNLVSVRYSVVSHRTSYDPISQTLVVNVIGSGPFSSNDSLVSAMMELLRRLPIRILEFGLFWDFGEVVSIPALEPAQWKEIGALDLGEIAVRDPIHLLRYLNSREVPLLRRIRFLPSLYPTNTRSWGPLYLDSFLEIPWRRGSFPFVTDIEGLELRSRSWVKGREETILRGIFPSLERVGVIENLEYARSALRHLEVYQVPPQEKD